MLPNIMSLLEFTTVEHFAHALADPSAGDVRRADIESRTAKMNLVMDEVIARFSPTPAMSAAQKAFNLKLVDGLVSMLSAHVDVQAANVEERQREGESDDIEMAIEVHDDTVRQYYRLMALRSDLDPECRPTGEVLESAADIDAWADRIFAQANAQA
jgi:hypothetical protein